MPRAAPAASPDHPNLVLALGRLRRLQLIWALLFAALGGLSLAVSGAARPVLPLVWLAIAVLLVARPEPILLALVAVAWGVSLVFLLPGVHAVFGGDPITTLFSPGPVETVALALARILLMITAWNQFLFYRLLYGTRGASGLDPALAPIPPVVENPAEGASAWSRFLGFTGVMAALLAVPLAARVAGVTVLSLGLGLALPAVGIGLGSAFVPNRRRGMALAGVLLGSLGLIGSLMVGRALYS